VSRIAAIGQLESVEGYGLAGVELLPAAGPADVRAAWAALDADVGLVLLTPGAAADLDAQLAEADDLLWVVLPE
jgi:vacuolar-type H+-ATPase subunit F/Vma7